jgi:hypothetical protein
LKIILKYFLGGEKMADKLTMKQEKYVQGLFAGLSQREAYALKFDALKKIGTMLGMFGKARGKETIGDPKVIMITAYWYFYIAEDYIQKYALAMLLDYYMPVWREIVGIENLCGIVDRNSKEVRQWRKEVLKRDNYKCVHCGSEENIQAHHIIEWSEFKETRTTVDNGITLCAECHAKKHEKISNFILSRVKVS